MTLSGKALSNYNVSDFITNLTSSPYFRDVDLKNVEEGKSGRIQFSVTGRFVNVLRERAATQDAGAAGTASLR